MVDLNLNKYRIRRLAEETDIVPEETLMDSISGHSAVEVPISQRVFNLFFVLIFGVLFFFIVKAFQLQVIKGDQFALLADQASGSPIHLSPVRGLVLDTQGRPLVQNIPIFELMAIRSLLPKPRTTLSQEVQGESESENEIQKMILELATIIGEDEPKVAKIFQDNIERGVFVIKSGLSKEEVLKIKELKPKGVFVVVNARRHYPDGPASAHLLGYTSMVTPEELSENDAYFINDRIGRLGLEAQYENYLRGESRVFDPRNLEEQNWKTEAGSLITTIDVEIQKKLYEAMVGVFSSADVRRGAAIVQDPRSGAVLGIVSMPSFDNNIFENPAGLDNSKRVSAILEGSDRPLLNRAIGGRYSPGSAIKPLLALVGLKEEIVTPSTLVYADGSISIQSEVDPSVFYTFRDWKVHGWTDIRKAISDSVDIFFYALGGGYKNINGLGIDKISKYLKIFRADTLTGIDLPGETKGFVPTREWKKETRGEGWYTGDNYNISIGQGDLLVTPIWLNSYIGAIANGGKIMKPFIVKKIQDGDGRVVEEKFPQVWAEIPFDVGVMNIVREGMRRTVTSGTATLLNDLPVPTAAKTGTAQVTGRGPNSLFTIYGPYENPEIVMTVLVENINQSQGLAIRVAKEFLSWYFGRGNYQQAP